MTSHLLSAKEPVSETPRCAQRDRKPALHETLLRLRPPSGFFRIVSASCATPAHPRGGPKGIAGHAAAAPFSCAAGIERAFPDHSQSTGKEPFHDTKLS
jgi:hypothetical protein